MPANRTEVMKIRGVAVGTMAQGQENGQFVDPDEFLHQMMSRRRLLRCDTNGATVRGLFDPQTGRRILVEESRLIEAMNRPPAGIS